MLKFRKGDRVKFTDNFFIKNKEYVLKYGGHGKIFTVMRDCSKHEMVVFKYTDKHDIAGHFDNDSVELIKYRPRIFL